MRSSSPCGVCSLRWDRWIHGWAWKWLVKWLRVASWAALGSAFIWLEVVTAVVKRFGVCLLRIHLMTFLIFPVFLLSSCCWVILLILLRSSCWCLA